MKFHLCHFVSLDELHLVIEFLVIGFPGGSGGKEPACNAGDPSSIPALQCSCLENLRDGGAWWLPSMGSHRVGHD